MQSIYPSLPDSREIAPNTTDVCSSLCERWNGGKRDDVHLFRFLVPISPFSMLCVNIRHRIQKESSWSLDASRRERLKILFKSLFLSRMQLSVTVSLVSNHSWWRLSVELSSISTWNVLSSSPTRGLWQVLSDFSCLPHCLFIFILTMGERSRSVIPSSNRIWRVILRYLSRSRESWRECNLLISNTIFILISHSCISPNDSGTRGQSFPPRSQLFPNFVDV